jgi:riboflavin biosynthesis pyrimidine reductase
MPIKTLKLIVSVDGRLCVALGTRQVFTNKYLLVYVSSRDRYITARGESFWRQNGAV